MRTRAIVLVLAISAASCADSDDSASTTDGSSVPSTTAAAVTTSTAADTTTTTPATTTSTLDIDDVEMSDEVLDYLVAVDELLIGTAYEDAVTEDPDVFVATGFLFCEQLTAGEQPADILTDYVEALTGNTIEDAEDDDLTLAGSILGTTVGYLCPEHTELIEEGL